MNPKRRQITFAKQVTFATIYLMLLAKVTLSPFEKTGESVTFASLKLLKKMAKVGESNGESEPTT